MSEEKEVKLFTHEQHVKWSKMREDTKKILGNIKKARNQNGDLYRIDFSTRTWIKITGLESDFAETGEIL